MVNVLVIGAMIALGLFLASTLAVWAYGRFAKRARGVLTMALPRDKTPSDLDHKVLQRLEQHPGHSGLGLIASNVEAFAMRVLSARHATRSLDLIYYIWEEDLTGSLLFEEVMLAANRGVRVRLLLDDVGASGRDAVLKLLNSHPNVSVRLFNPTRARRLGLRRGIEMALRIFSVTRRMHNKAWIVDGRLAIMGGRNIGDAYFDAVESGTNFRDFDLLAIGPVVDQAEGMFDSYWNSSVTLPLRALAGEHDDASRLSTLRAARRKFEKRKDASPYQNHIANTAQLDLPDRAALHWCAEARLVADPPDKALGRQGENWMMATLQPIMMAAKSALCITSPYFIPGTQGTAELTELAARGVKVSVLTNSLAATDVAAVHGGYARYRKPLLQAGVALHELRPTARKKRLSFRGKSNASLHTKAFRVDQTTGFIGSLNFDPRSASLNTEMGVLFDSRQLIAEMSQYFTEETSADLSYRLSLTDSGQILWHGDEEDGIPPHRHDPAASLGRRIFAWIVGRLPLESQL